MSQKNMCDGRLFDAWRRFKLNSRSNQYPMGAMIFCTKKKNNTTEANMLYHKGLPNDFLSAPQQENIIMARNEKFDQFRISLESHAVNFNTATLDRFGISLV